MTDDDPGQPTGYELARKALEDARAAARAAGKSVGQGRSSPRKTSGGSRRSARRGWSGPRPDANDPQLLGRVAGQIARNRGWGDRISEGSIFGSWDTVVGPDVAGHARPTLLRDRVLHIQAESTAWATQLRLMQSQILGKIAAAVGNGVVTSLRITGPRAPSWRKGEFHVRGRGPRDTYG